MTYTTFKAGFAIAAAVLFAAIPASAQADRMRVEIPFSFVAGETVMPAGTYFVSLAEESRILGLETFNRAIRIPVNGPGVRRGQARIEYGSLLFEKVGSAHILKNVWNRNRVEGCTLRPSRIERELKAGRETTITVAWAR